MEVFWPCVRDITLLCSKHWGWGQVKTAQTGVSGLSLTDAGSTLRTIIDGSRQACASRTRSPFNFWGDLLTKTLCLSACRPSDMPWLYYHEAAKTVLTDESIPTSYQFPDGMLVLLASVFHADGSFRGYRRTTGGLLQLCKNSNTFMDAAYVFGTTYDHAVSGTTLSLSLLRTIIIVTVEILLWTSYLLIHVSIVLGR